jgi:hypothetical protein
MLRMAHRYRDVRVLTCGGGRAPAPRKQRAAPTAAPARALAAPRPATLIAAQPPAPRAPSRGLDPHAPRRFQAIDYRIASVATVKTFLRRIMQQLGAAEAARGGCVDGALYFLAAYLAEASLLEYSMLSYLPSRVAAAALSLAHVLLGRALPDAALRGLTGYGAADVAAPAHWLLRVHAALSETGGLYAVAIKYKSPEMACAAEVPPIASRRDPRLAAVALVAAPAACRDDTAAAADGSDDARNDAGVPRPPTPPAAAPSPAAPCRSAAHAVAAVGLVAA